MVNARRRLPARNRAADNTAKPRRKQYRENKNRSNERFFIVSAHAFRGAEKFYSAFIPTTSPAFPSTTLKLSRAESAMAASMSAGCTPSGSQPSDLSM